LSINYIICISWQYSFYLLFFFKCYNILIPTNNLIMSEQFDNILTGIIILLVILVVWKWYGDKADCNSGEIKLSCGCKPGKCRCRGGSRVRMPGAGGSCNGQSAKKVENMVGPDGVPVDSKGIITTTPTDTIDPNTDDSYSEITKQMSLEQEVTDSHSRYVNDLYTSGLPTGASASSILEETGRSYGTADFHGLTARKWCKARQMATPGAGSRVVPSHDILENCNISLTDLV
jgi:hypothetical protein